MEPDKGEVNTLHQQSEGCKQYESAQYLIYHQCSITELHNFSEPVLSEPSHDKETKNMKEECQVLSQIVQS